MSILSHLMFLLSLLAFLLSFLINCRPTGVYSSARVRKISWKRSHNFRRLSLFSILYIDLIEYAENRDKEFRLRPMLTTPP